MEAKNVNMRYGMKVFISWSGEKSKKIAEVFRDWLPQVIQAIEPFVSFEDIKRELDGILILLKNSKIRTLE